MKRTLAILISGLILLGTPLLASAHDGDRYDNGPRHYNSWVKDRHAGEYGWQKPQPKWERKLAKRHYKQHVREQRREHRFYARQHRSYYSEPAVFIGVPNLMLHIGW
ncbi:hypothetical protein [Malonomonas rubra]|uniref:hypothetical protein n=1 Tax=Malonomonas rubra TaxID=57040 RepID=UPI0026F161DC|nr:hypothetical protein [Malonomonas rubra]